MIGFDLPSTSIGARSRGVVLVAAALVAALHLSGCSAREEKRANAVNLPEAPSERAKHFFNMGWIAGHNSKLQLAVENFRKAIELAPSFAEAHHGLGLAYAKMGYVDQSIPELNEAIRYKPDFDEAYFNLGVAYGRKGDFEVAEEMFLTALRLNPKHDASHLSLAQLYRQRGDSDRTKRHLLVYLDLKPHDTVARTGLADMYFDQGLLRSAAPEYRRSLRDDPKSIRALYRLGVIHHNTNQLDGAKAYYQRVLQLDANHVEALTNLGTIYASEGNVSQALTEFERALGVDSSNAFAQQQIRLLRQKLRGYGNQRTVRGPSTPPAIASVPQFDPYDSPGETPAMTRDPLPSAARASHGSQPEASSSDPFARYLDPLLSNR